VITDNHAITQTPEPGISAKLNLNEAIDAVKLKLKGERRKTSSSSNA